MHNANTLYTCKLYWIKYKLIQVHTGEIIYRNAQHNFCGRIFCSCTFFSKNCEKNSPRKHGNLEQLSFFCLLRLALKCLKLSASFFDYYFLYWSKRHQYWTQKLSRWREKVFFFYSICNASTADIHP